MENDTYEIILYVINQELSMYDELSKNEPYKVDREKAAHAWNAINDIKIEITDTRRKE